MPTLLPYLDQLGPEWQQVFNKPSTFSNQLVLGGGTALMLQIGHRISYDFDCFSLDLLKPTLIKKAKKVFNTPIFPLLNTNEQISFSVRPNIEITFLYYPYPALNTSVQTSGIPVFQLDDLVSNKAYAIGRRGVWRDYVDIFFLLKWQICTLPKIVDLSQKKFGGEFNPKLFVQQLTYFSDLQIIPTEFLKESYTPDQIQSFLETQVENYLKTILPL